MDLQEAIYNVVPAYQDIFFDRGLGYPSGALKTVCRDNETIIDVIPGCARPFSTSPPPPPPRFALVLPACDGMSPSHDREMLELLFRDRNPTIGPLLNGHCPQWL